MYDASENVSGMPFFRRNVSKSWGKLRFRTVQTLADKLHKGEGFHWESTTTCESSHDVDVGHHEVSSGYSEARHVRDAVASQVGPRRVFVASLEGKRKQDVLLRLQPPGALWRKLLDVFRPKTNGARLAFLEKSNGVEIGFRDNPEQRLLDMDDVARDLNSCGDYQFTSENPTLLNLWTSCRSSTRSRKIAEG